MTPPHKFPTLKAALSYHDQCPICDGALTLDNDPKISVESMSSRDDIITEITFRVGEDRLIIDLNTERVSAEFRENRYGSMVYSIGGSAMGYIPGTAISGGLPHSGIYIQGFGRTCLLCCQFSYAIQAIIDMGEMRLAGCYLNSESVTLQIDNIVHEVRNVYSTGKTEYSAFTKSGADNVFSMPIIPLDLRNPEDTIARIRKLIIFS